ncbi:hypothetical protein WOLCODRAFT_140758 [Wolfiporia cocos MD-104 SS10]|uniref:Microtubule associated protein n=1 Tax=Wolfiporia cocos (strain MD-104) TaxID=742152 RepID=A0A2H3JEN1_WOLCO|nr:hypothetical protein WOLCODRAFT_140758 [Wolfiporia cocos MD-104 SS10]
MTTTTITSLLDSLHAHLQSQTQLLPPLHAQLGLPATALTDELATLQRQLTECVESQVNLRRKQVDEWVQKCDGVEEECIQFTKALGGNSKATRTSLGEIRKEPVLPRRYEVICEYQAKLRHLYHTKLEQLWALTNKITALSRTLGPDFFPPDIVNLTPAAHRDEDESSHRDVTPERFGRLEKELVRGKAEVTKRLARLAETMVDLDWLYTQLGEEPPEPEEPSPALTSARGLPLPSRSASVCSSRTTHSTASDLFLSSTLSSVPMSTPTPTARTKPGAAPLLSLKLPEDPPDASEAEYQRIYLRFVAWLENASEEELLHAHAGLEGADPTPGLIAWAEGTQARLEALKAAREARIQALYDQLVALWRRMGVPEADMDAFVEQQMGSTEAAVGAYEEELERMLELKRENMGAFVAGARAEIVRLWDALLVGEEERAIFAPFADDEYTEELLEVHQEEIQRLETEKRLKGPLLTKVKKYLDVCEDEKELAAAASDQSRLLGRGPRDPGRLLREEKMRKRVAKEKPKLEQDLLTSIPAWEADTGQIFLVHGESILQRLMESVSANDKENTHRRTRSQTAKIASASGRSKTPNSNLSQAYAPSSSQGNKSNASSASTRPGSSMSSSSSSQPAPPKRTRLGESTGTHNNGAQMGPPKTFGLQRPGGSAKDSAKTLVPVSSLPRPVLTAVPVPKLPPLPPPSYGRVGAVKKAQRTHAYHPYRSSQRTGAGAGSGGAAQRAGRGPAQASMFSAQKAMRARRESFKPRASMGEEWAAGADADAGQPRWAGFSDVTVKEEPEED